MGLAHQRKTRAQRKKCGLCVHCGHTRNHYASVCDVCRAKDTLRKREKLGLSEWREGGRGRPPATRK